MEIPRFIAASLRIGETSVNSISKREERGKLRVWGCGKTGREKQNLLGIDVLSTTESNVVCPKPLQTTGL